MNLPPLLLLFSLSGLGEAFNGANGSSIALPSDPYLQFRPPFVRSLPIQILLTGIVLTLVIVLFILLMLTAQYHWPLAPVNYVLQLSGVITLTISLIATLHVVLSTAVIESQRWPYMLGYIAVNVPPLSTQNATTSWSIAERVTWLIMNASTSGLIQITHIHFLTLLYPSRLEGRLILTLLVPLAVAAAVMQLIPIEGIESPRKSVVVSLVVRNICNATLSLLFTTALFIWGFLVNRRQAWRIDGGTAIFGFGALSLALISTALNFLYVDRAEEYVWLPGLMWAVVLWQSFLGWWWWVGAGSGSGLLSISETFELEERLRRQEKREMRRRETKERRRAARVRAKKVIKDMTGVFGRPGNNDDSDSASTAMAGSSTTAVNTFNSNNTESERRRRHNKPSADENVDMETEFSDAELEAQDAPTVAAISSHHTGFQRIVPEFVFRWYASLKHAHLEAARDQEVERAKRIRGLGRRHPIRMGGWGLGSFGWRRAREWSSEHEDHEGFGQAREDRWAPSLKRTPSEETLTSRTATMAADEPQNSWSSEKEHRASSDLPLRSSDRPTPNAPAVPPPTHSRSIWWWGPLGRWRLQDTTVY